MKYYFPNCSRVGSTSIVEIEYDDHRGKFLEWIGIYYFHKYGKSMHVGGNDEKEAQYCITLRNELGKVIGKKCYI